MKKLRIVIAVILLLIVGIIITGLTLSLRTTDEKLKSFLQKNEVNGSVGYFNSGQYTIRYLQTGDTSANLVFIFIHGAPGSLEMFKTYLKDERLITRGMVVSIDRPGYGYSNYGKSETSIQKQGEIIDRFIKATFPGKRIIFIGHSFGAPIAAYAAYLNNKQTQAVVLAAGAVDPEFEKFQFLAKLTNMRLIKLISNYDTRVATEEKLEHESELRKIVSIWKKLDTDVIVIHGNRDQLVPIENIHFLKDHISKDHLMINTLKNRGHMFVFQEDIIIEHLIDYLSNNTK